MNVLKLFVSSYRRNKFYTTVNIKLSDLEEYRILSYSAEWMIRRNVKSIKNNRLSFVPSKIFVIYCFVFKTEDSSNNLRISDLTYCRSTLTYSFLTLCNFEEAAWPSGLGRWICNLVQILHPTTIWICSR